MRRILILLLLAAPLCIQAQLKYDEKGPDFNPPTLERAKSKDYDPLNTETFSIWVNHHSVAAPKQQSERHAIWCTKEATYLAETYHTAWPLHYFHCTPNNYIEDCDTGEKYYMKQSIGYPVGETYWVRSLSYEWVMFVHVYPPLPPTCTTISTGGGGYSDDLEPGWGHEEELDHVSIASLQANQPLMKRKEVVIVY